jgi:hypothetical protein
LPPVAAPALVDPAAASVAGEALADGVAAAVGLGLLALAFTFAK